MSSAEIADNPWELAATKPPVATVGGFAMIITMAGFGVFFGWITVASIYAAITPKKEDQGLAGQFKKLEKGEQPAATPTQPEKTE